MPGLEQGRERRSQPGRRGAGLSFLGGCRSPSVRRAHPWSPARVGLGSEGLLLGSWLPPGDRGHRVCGLQVRQWGLAVLRGKIFTEMGACLGTCHAGEPRQTRFLRYSRVLEGISLGISRSLHLVTQRPVYSAETWSPHSTEQTLGKLF